MRNVLIALLVVCVVGTAVAVAFGQGRQPGQGQGRQRQPRGFQASPSMSSVIAGGKIYVLKEGVIYKINATDLKVEKKKKLELPKEEGQANRFARMLGGPTLKVEGKALYILDRTAIHKVNLDSLELAGSLKAGDLTPPEEEKEEEEEKGGGDF